jgi:hypothetical protein
MDVSQVKWHVHDMLERARRASTERRAETDAAATSWERIREEMAVPLARQVAQVLRAEGYAFQVFTPADVVRLSSEKSGEDFVELALDAAGRRPSIVARINRIRGREVLSDERVLAEGADIEQLDEERVLAFLLDAMMAVVQR